MLVDRAIGHCVDSFVSVAGQNCSLQRDWTRKKNENILMSSGCHDSDQQMMVIEHWTWKVSLLYVAKFSQSKFSKFLNSYYEHFVVFVANEQILITWKSGTLRRMKRMGLTRSRRSGNVNCLVLMWLAAHTNCRFWYAMIGKSKLF